MPYKLLWEPRGVYLKFGGTVTGTDILNAVKAALGDARFDELRYMLSDYLDATALVMTPSEIEDLAAYAIGAHVQRPKGRVAVTATQPEIIAMVKRFDAMQDNGYPVAIFPTLDEARAWVREITLPYQ